jgi:alkylation response protein AidB-like acyl-CoA dehydrogenase
MYYEELALAGAPEPVNMPGIVLLGPTLMVHGSEALQDRFLPGILSGDEIWCQGFSEPGAGSDLAAVRTRARLDGDRWLIDGQKVWTTWAMEAEWCFVLCRTDPASTRHRGLTLLMVRMDQPGITARPIVQMSGDAEFGEVFFDGAETDSELTLGAPGEGWQASMTMFGFERADQGFTDHARLLVQLAGLGRELRDAEEKGRLDGAMAQLARQRFADLWIRCQQLRRMNLRLAIHLDQGNQIGLEGSSVNLFWGELEKALAEFAAWVRGPEALIHGTSTSHKLLSSRAASIYSGTSEIQRNIIAERLLGLPR